MIDVVQCKRVSRSAIKKELTKMKKKHPEDWKRAKTEVKKTCPQFTEKMLIDQAVDYSGCSFFWECPTASDAFEVTLEELYDFPQWMCQGKMRCSKK